MSYRQIHFSKGIAPPVDLIRFWWGFLFLITLMNFWRLAFLISQHEFLIASKWDIYLKSFLIGIRLDAVVASYLMLPLGAALIVQLIKPKKSIFR